MSPHQGQSAPDSNADRKIDCSAADGVGQPDEPAPTVDQRLLDHLDTAQLPKEAEELVFAALLGEEELRAALGGEPPSTPPDAAPDPAGGAPVRAYLTGIEVQGFRGIGQAATLDLVPGPGLTVVAGRNGSGKSSFAEAVELALTGDNQRWANQPQVWRDGWRNLHCTGERYLRVKLGIDGNRGEAVAETRWPSDGDLGDFTTFLQRTGQPRQLVADLGWEQPLQLYRPFLSYSELGALLSGTPSAMHDSLHRVLGLDRLTEIEKRLKDARRDSDATRRRATDELSPLLAALAAHSDPRARQAEQLLAAAHVDLDELDQLASAEDPADDGELPALRALAAVALPDREQFAAQVARLQQALDRVDQLAATPAAEARALAGLLQAALAHQQDHPDRPCPVCGGRVLDAEWAASAREQVQQLTNQATQLDEAHQQLRRCRGHLPELVPPTPAVLYTDALEIDLTAVRDAWRSWDALLRADDPRQLAAGATARFDAIAAALGPVQEAADRALAHRHQAWQPVAEQLRGWAETCRRSRQAQGAYTAARKAVDWLVGVGAQIRNEQLAPLADEATEIWKLLRQDSNVDLGAIQLAGTGNRRRVDLNVAVDGEAGAALGVMSQGELHALALSLFLPRATMPASPFRFLVIDDPVQSMDPAKVYGLARVLARVAADRQVIVFTHDDRLPTAIRHLGIKAHLRTVDRRERSQVTVSEVESPALRYLADARAVANDPNVDSPLRGKTICVLLRDAIEAQCHDRVMAGGIRAGRSIRELESELAEPNRVRQILALALFGDPSREGDVNIALRRLHPRAPQVVGDVSRGAHGEQVAGDPMALIRDVQELIKKLGGRR